MKRTLLAVALALVAVLPMKALDYESARQQAWFLTDKMAYELNLTSEQYDRIYQINLDYFLSVNSPSDAFGYYWSYRNEDLRYILFDWQYRLYCGVDYFYRPIRWMASSWYFPIFNRYRVGYYYFDRPGIFFSYRGGFGHGPRPGGVSPYRGMHFNAGPGMRDTHRPPSKGWGEGRGVRPDGRPSDRSGGRPGGSNPGFGGGQQPSQGGGVFGGNTGRPGQGSGNQGGGNGRPGQGGGSHGGTGNGNAGGGSSVTPPTPPTQGGSATQPGRPSTSGSPARGGSYSGSRNFGGSTARPSSNASPSRPSSRSAGTGTGGRATNGGRSRLGR